MGENKMENNKNLKGIYGEDVGVLMGVNDSVTLLDIYNKVMNPSISKEVEEQNYWTRTLEETISKEFSVRTNKKIRTSNKYEIDKEFNFMISDITRKVVGENAILYCKVIKQWEEKEWEGDQIPPKEFFKVQHDMEIKKADMCYIAALIDDKKFIFRPVSRDNEIINIIIEAEKRFWSTYIEKKQPPNE